MDIGTSDTIDTAAPRVNTAMILRQRIAVLGLKHSDVAEAIGYTKGNIISMFKSGETALPASKVSAMAKVLEVDPIYLFRLVIQDAHPEMAQAISDVHGDIGLVSESERDLLIFLRSCAKGYSIAPPNEEERNKLAELVSGWARQQHNTNQERVRHDAKCIGKPEKFTPVSFEEL